MIPDRLDMNPLFSIVVVVVTLLLYDVQPACARAPDPISEIADGLESQEGSDAFNAAAERARGLSDMDAGRLAQELQRRILADAQRDSRILLNLYRAGLKAGPNRLVGVLGRETSGALEGLLDNLFNEVFSNIVTSNIAQRLLLSRLQELLRDIGGDTADASRILGNLVNEASRLHREQQAAEGASSAGSRSGQTLNFVASSGILTLTDDRIFGVIRDGGTDFTDSIVGAEVDFPVFELDNFDPAGNATFVNISGSPLIIRSGSDIFLQSTLTGLLWDGSRFTGLGSDLVLSGAPSESPYDGGLPELGSPFIRETNDRLLPFDLNYFFTVFIDPDVNFAVVTDNFSRDGSTPFTNGIGLTQPQAIPEPASVALLTTGVVALLICRWRRFRESIPRTHVSP